MSGIALLGFTLDEYRHMFDLSDEDLNGTLLDCYAGAASFNAEMTLLDKTVTSCDPLYKLSQNEIETELLARCKDSEDYLLSEQEKFNWQEGQTLQDFIQRHELAIEAFCEDYIRGLKQSRYLDAHFPHLTLPDNSFDLALCSHFLFSQEHQTEKFMLNSIADMCRIAQEARIFPLLDPAGEASPFIGPIIKHFQEQNYGVEVRQVDYEFQKGGNAMLRVWQNECNV